MQLTNSTTDCRDDIITNALHSLRRTFYNYAIAYRMDVDDLMQEAVIIMLEIWDRIPEAANKAAYLHVVVRHRINNLVPDEAPLSLDAPITESGLTLGEIIAAPAAPQIDYTYIDYVTRVVHWALQQLPPEVQLYATETFEITGFKPLRQSKSMSQYVQSVYKRRRKADMKKELKASLECNPAILDLFTRKKRSYSRVQP